MISFSLKRMPTRLLKLMTFSAITFSNGSKLFVTELIYTRAVSDSICRDLDDKLWELIRKDPDNRLVLTQVRKITPLYRNRIELMDDVVTDAVTQATWFKLSNLSL